MFCGQRICMTAVHAFFKLNKLYGPSPKRQEELKEFVSNEFLNIIKMIYHACGTWCISMNHELTQVYANHLHNFLQTTTLDAVYNYVDHM